MQVKTSVVGYDGSENAQRALEAATDLAADDGVVHVVTAYHQPSAAELKELVRTLPDEYIKDLDTVAHPRGLLRDAKDFLKARDVDVVGHFVEDKPAAAILDVADEVDADLIIVGSRGLGLGARFVRGSVSSRVANHAQRSFLVVHD